MLYPLLIRCYRSTGTFTLMTIVANPHLKTLWNTCWCVSVLNEAYENPHPCLICLLFPLRVKTSLFVMVCSSVPRVWSRSPRMGGVVPYRTPVSSLNRHVETDWRQASCAHRWSCPGQREPDLGHGAAREEPLNGARCIINIKADWREVQRD